MLKTKVEELSKQFSTDLEKSQQLVQTESSKIEQLKGAIYTLGLVSQFIKQEEEASTQPELPIEE